MNNNTSLTKFTLSARPVPGSAPDRAGEGEALRRATSPFGDGASRNSAAPCLERWENEGGKWVYS
jgi:hypothetical protein